MNEAVSSSGNSSGQGRDLYSKSRDTSIQTDKMGLSQSKEQRNTSENSFLLKVLIGIFNSSIIIQFYLPPSPQILFKGIIFLWALSIKIVHFSPWKIPEMAEHP